MMMAHLMQICRDLSGPGLFVCEAESRKGLALIVSEWKNLPPYSNLHSKTQISNGLLSLE